MELGECLMSDKATGFQLVIIIIIYYYYYYYYYYINLYCGRQQVWSNENDHLRSHASAMKLIDQLISVKFL